ncbi:MAG TPA: hypothetical protein VGG07_11300 [Solirubrobacteraceae bacterium]
MRVLVITSSTDATTGDGAAYTDWVNTLNREGVPFDTVVTSSQGLPSLSSTGPDGTQIANYEGVIVAGSGLEGMTSGEWTTLQTFEQQFSVRQLTANAVPGPDYGLNTPANGGDSQLPSSTLLNLTADGQGVFPYLNSIALDPSYPTFGAETTVASNPGGAVDTLVSGPANSTMLGIYTTPDGRQTMFQTFNMGPGYLQSELVRHGELAWLGRNTYFGDQRNYLETDIDDNFLSDDAWSTTTHSTDYNPADALREVPADVTAAAGWSASTGVRIDMLFNGGGSSEYAANNGGTDPLVATFQANKGNFGWINHTWDHPNIDQGCANATYIENELKQNTSWGTTTLGLASGTAALGTQNPAVVVTGEHSGLANLIPGNPGTVDPPEFNAVTPVAGTTAFVLGSYTYAITDDFVAGGGQSSASETAVTLAAGDSVNISWDPVCHAADYYIYRQNPDLSWTLVDTRAAQSSDFGNNGPVEINFSDTDLGTAATTVPSTTANNASESAYQQNTNLQAAFANVGITAFGSDASKPYPNPATLTFANGTALSSAQEFPTATSFTDGGAQAVPRYPTNIYYNVSTQAQETDEFNTLYQAPPAGICNTATTACISTPWSFQQIIDSVVGVNGPYLGMFQHMMGNDPRPDYFHQTNMMSQATGAASATGNGLYYTVMNELLRTYNQYFKANAPIEQLTMADIATLLSEQTKWLAVNRTQVTGSIEGSAVTLNNTGSALELPLTGMTTVGSDYAGSHSGWTLAPAGKSTYTAQTAWPAPPVVPVIVTVPTGPAPTLGPGQTTPKPQPGSPPAPKGGSKPPAAPIVYLAVQAAPKTVGVSHGKVTVSLSCKASKGRTAKGKLCAGAFTLTVAGHKVSHSFRFKSGKVSRITVKLPKLSMSVVTAAVHHKPKARKTAGKLVITTKLSPKSSRSVKGSLTIKG